MKLQKTVRLRLKSTTPTLIRLGSHDCVLKVSSALDGGKTKWIVAITKGPHPGFVVQVSKNYYETESEANESALAGFDFAELTSYGIDSITQLDSLKHCSNVEIISGRSDVPAISSTQHESGGPPVSVD